MGGASVGIHGRWGNGGSLRRGVFPVGFLDLREQCGSFWGGIVDACDFCVGGFRVGIREYKFFLVYYTRSFGDRLKTDCGCFDFVETIRQLLRPHVRSLRAFIPFPEFPLVLRQIADDGLETTMV